MRKLVVTMFVSLDGVIENPAWTAPYWSDEIAAFKGEEMQASDALLLGRVTYEGFAQAWPNRTDDPGAEQMNSLPKYVATTTLRDLAWNNSHVLEGDTVTAIEQLKRQPGKNILVYGSGALVRTLLRHNLIDEFRLLVYPVVLGAGQRLFNPGDEATLTLASAQAMSSGVVGLVYTPAAR